VARPVYCEVEVSYFVVLQSNCRWQQKSIQQIGIWIKDLYLVKELMIIELKKVEWTLDAMAQQTVDLVSVGRVCEAPPSTGCVQ